MRIKRFTAPDMRTALRMIRDEQGPDAVILSNRAVEAGIEVVAATDYDEALVAQALRAAAPGLDTASMPTAAPAMTMPAAARAAIAATAAATPLAARSAIAQPAPTAATTTNAIRHPQPAAERASELPAAARESLFSRARAVFRIGDGALVADAPTLAELAAQPGTMQAPAAPRSRTVAVAGAATTSPPPPAIETTPAPTRFEAMMAALNPPEAAAAETSAGRTGVAIATTPDMAKDASHADAVRRQITPPGARDADDRINRADDAGATHAAAAAVPAAPRILQAVATVAGDAAQAADPAIAAMRDELGRMRQLMEAQMERLSLERLRGSPARAAVFDALTALGCEDTLAQAVAAKIDPRLPPSEVREPMFAELARMLTIARAEPLDDGGVIALVGPTGAGKTTTAAKLAARFAERHRARDVALVTTDNVRAGAREQLHAHGRRLGITVCEAAGPEGLQDALAQLVDYPLVLVDTTGHAPRDRALFSQILWLRASRKVRSLLVLPANAHPHDLGEVIRRYRPSAPEGVVLTKLDEAGRLGSALSVAIRHGLSLAYTTQGQQVPSDIDSADATRLVQTLEKSCRVADNPLATEDRHAVV